MLSMLSEYFMLFIVLNIFVKSLWFHKVFLFRWNYAFSGGKWFQQSFPVLSAETERFIALLQVAHHGSFIMQRREVTLKTVHRVTVTCFPRTKPLCVCLHESNDGWSGGLCNGQDESKNQTKQSHAKSVYKIIALAQLSYHYIYTKLFI